MHKTRKEWASLNPYFQGSMRSTAAPVVIKMKEDMEELWERIKHLRKTIKNLKASMRKQK